MTVNQGKNFHFKLPLRSHGSVLGLLPHGQSQNTSLLFLVISHDTLRPSPWIHPYFRATPNTEVKKPVFVQIVMPKVLPIKQQR